MAKCPKCEGVKFDMEKVESPTKMALIVCADCNTVITAMENIDIAKWKSDMVQNHNYFEREIKTLKAELHKVSQKVSDQNVIIIDLLERLNNKIS